MNVETLLDVAQRTQMVLDRIAYEANAEKFAEKGECFVVMNCVRLEQGWHGAWRERLVGCCS